ncbi:GNAT family N-acetyltransferase [Pseudoalteromonas piscicida]|uniref:GNAT family N-acetyltransferase n=1 Tax=Pseudoalteromonas piscicida TaxID=43662 RepID=A0A2A5JSA1_PSEO7|nr:GNAT family N-acetyltransferase [Pseudoalteromonas piscicida]PCK32151.1 GNAT family N-acetyltransferase [Pseudoalteromonas piscicida]
MANNNIHFVKAKKCDLNYLVALRKATMVPHLENAKLFLSEAEHKARVLYEYSCSHLIYVDGMCVGLAKFKQRENDYYLFQLQIEPQQQGRGLGAQVINSLIDSNSKLPWVLTVLKANPAKQLYERLGFVAFDEDEYEFHLRREPSL